MKCKIVLTFEAGNVDFVKLAKSLSEWKIKKLIMVKKKIDEDTAIYKKKFGKIRIPVVFLFNENKSNSQMNFDQINYYIKTPITADLIKFYSKDKKEISKQDIKKIIDIKLKDLNCSNKDSALKIIEGTCKSFNIKVI